MNLYHMLTWLSECSAKILLQTCKQQAEAHAFPLLLIFGEGLPAAPEPAAALAAALPGLRDAAALAAATQVVRILRSW